MNEKHIFAIIDKFDSSSIGELELSDGTYRLMLKKDRPVLFPAADAAASAPGTTAVRLGITGAANAESGEGAAALGEKITSPIVAIYYAAPGPDAPPFVKPGSRVKAGQTLCILEAMKMMNHLEAEFDCEITETHASSGDLVEYGQTIFTVKRL